MNTHTWLFRALVILAFLLGLMGLSAVSAYPTGMRLPDQLQQVIQALSTNPGQRVSDRPLSWRETWRNSENWNTDTGSWVPEDRWQTFYAADWYISQTLKEHYSNNVWANSQRQTYQYSASYQQLTMLSEVWSANAWTNSYQQENTYNDNGWLMSTLSSVWINNAWQNSNLTTYTRNPNGTLASHLSQSWSNGAWANSFQSFYSYDQYGQPHIIDSELWQNNAWVPYSRVIYTNSSPGLILSILMQNWNADTQTYDDFYQMLYTYNAQNKLEHILTQMITQGIWTDVSQNLYYYDTNGNNTEYVMQSWISGWQNSMHFLMEYEQFTVPVQDENISPAGFDLSIHPNPFRGNASIRFKTPASGLMKLVLFNCKGQCLNKTELRYPPDTQMQWNWDGRDMLGKELPAGIYYLKAVSANGSASGSKKLVKY